MEIHTIYSLNGMHGDFVWWI